MPKPCKPNGRREESGEFWEEFLAEDDEKLKDRYDST
jgi:hypothetical protein